MSSIIKRIALNDGLKAGLTIILTQMYAYIGFLRSLNGITTFMTVLQEREQIGIKDPQGEPSTPVPTTSDKYEIGKNNLYHLTKVKSTEKLTGSATFASGINPRSTYKHGVEYGIN